MDATSPIALIGLDSEGTIELWDSGAAELFGWPEAELIGRRLPPELRALTTVTFGPATLTTRSGQAVTIDLRSAKSASGGTVITAMEPARHDKHAELTRFRELLEAAPDAILQVDPNGTIVLANQAAEELFGYTRDQLLGLNVDALVAGDLGAAHGQHRARFHSRPTRRPMGQGQVFKARRRDGGELPVEISLSPASMDESPRVTAIIRDVTPRRKAEEEIRSINQQLELRRREAERANALKSEFLASMSHELRTPLHTILGFTELLREESAGPLNDKQKRFLHHVHQDSTQLLELINDILDLSKIEAGRMDLQIEGIDAAEMIAETIESVTARAEAKGIRLENAVSTPVYVRADKVRLREIVLNLLTNAIKFTPEGGEVRVDYSRPRMDMVEISVTDTGIGIAPADQDVIFDKFRQIASTTRGVREGTGLGLAIVKRLVEMHKGETSLASEPGRGSRFAFTIPADLAHPREEFCALIIEDSQSAAELLCSYLDPLGVKTECAETAEEGVRKAQRLRPDVIFLDLLLPGESGWRVLEQLRAALNTRSVPVIVTSVMDFDRAALARGATGYLQKPLKKEAVYRALGEHIPSRFGNIQPI